MKLLKKLIEILAILSIHLNEDTATLYGTTEIKDIPSK